MEKVVLTQTLHRQFSCTGLPKNVVTSSHSPPCNQLVEDVCIFFMRISNTNAQYKAATKFGGNPARIFDLLQH
ncbi:hypothetical protein [Chryseolinea sp. H1M3-3]|uniref:hypothetical protein n=1 Tax=Chryseolinea sp. H1M3-3 TaxID=3034144 RepID=UPI0023EC96AA|nr:hypothetical protein [Chryseolinea sp. H1M3-3]